MISNGHELDYNYIVSNGYYLSKHCNLPNFPLGLVQIIPVIYSMECQVYYISWAVFLALILCFLNLHVCYFLGNINQVMFYFKLLVCIAAVGTDSHFVGYNGFTWLWRSMGARLRRAAKATWVDGQLLLKACLLIRASSSSGQLTFDTGSCNFAVQLSARQLLCIQPLYAFCVLELIKRPSALYVFIICLYILPFSADGR